MQSNIEKALNMLDSIQPTIYILHIKFEDIPNSFSFAFSTRLNRAIFEDQFESKYCGPRHYIVTRQEVPFNCGLRELNNMLDKIKS